MFVIVKNNNSISLFCLFVWKLTVNENSYFKEITDKEWGTAIKIYLNKM